MITIREMLTIERFKVFKCIAGSKGFDRQLKKVSLLDYEIIEQFDEQFFEHEFALSSLLGAKNKPELILPSIQYLNENGVCGLAVKNIYYETLPDNVIDYCNDNDFPIFIFDNSVFFEDLITDVRDVLRDLEQQREKEIEIDLLLHGDTSEKTRIKLFNELTNYYDGVYKVIYLRNTNDQENSKRMKIVGSFKNRKISTVIFLMPYKNGFLMGYSADSFDVKCFSSDCNYLGLRLKDYYIGIADDAEGVDGFRKSCSEALWTSRIAKVENKGYLDYPSIGVYKILQPLADSPLAENYIKEIITPLKTYDQQHGTELFHTAEIFVAADGQIIQTGKTLFQHSNTIRYRINKMKSILGFEDKEGIFFEHLSIAFRLLKITDL